MTDYALVVADQAQRWHETDHGPARGKVKKRPHVTPREDDVPDNVPESFRECQLCKPVPPLYSTGQHVNPFWFRVIAWETES